MSTLGNWASQNGVWCVFKNTASPKLVYHVSTTQRFNLFLHRTDIFIELDSLQDTYFIRSYSSSQFRKLLTLMWKR